MQVGGGRSVMGTEWGVGWGVKGRMRGVIITARRHTCCCHVLIHTCSQHVFTSKAVGGNIESSAALFDKQVLSHIK